MNGMEKFLILFGAGIWIVNAILNTFYLTYGAVIGLWWLAIIHVVYAIKRFKETKK